MFIPPKYGNTIGFDPSPYIYIYIYIHSIFSLSSHSISIHGDTRILRASSRQAPTKSKPNGTSEPWTAFETLWFLLEMDVAENGCIWKCCLPHFPNGFADHYPYFLWLFVWEYSLFSDKPKWSDKKTRNLPGWWHRFDGWFILVD